MVSAQDALERLPEFGTEDGVDDRIERRIEVAQPQEERGDLVVDFARVAQRHKQRHQEERQPTHDKGARDDGQRFGRLTFALRLERFFARAHLRMRIWCAVAGGGSG